MPDVSIGPYTVEISNPDKMFFPDAGLTKGDLVNYYHRIAEQMVPFLEDRPLTLHRFPDGIRAEGFFQQSAPDYFPDWIGRVTVEKESGTVTHVVCNNEATLVYLANQGVVTPHAWLSRTDTLHHPDRMVFDLDPQDDDFDGVRRGALATRDLLDQLGLVAFVMTTGSSGLHVVVPLDRSADFDMVRAFARDIAEVLARRHPDTMTVEQRKAKRKGRLFLDTLRNAYGQTAVPPYAVRALPDAPVATPLDWYEVGHADVHPRRYTTKNLFRRLGQKNNPWSDFGRQIQGLDKPRDQLDALLVKG